MTYKTHEIAAQVIVTLIGLLLVLILVMNLRQNSTIHANWVDAMRAWEKEMKISQNLTIQEISDLENIVTSDIEIRTQDRFKGEDHTRFLNDFYDANPDLVRPKGW